MRMDELLDRAQETLSGGRVFGEVVNQDGITVIPAASVLGGGGGGSGLDERGQEGTGGGFGMRARPAGAYVIDDGVVRWQPAVDVNRLVASLVTLGIAVLVYRWRLAAIRVRAERTSG